MARCRMGRPAKSRSKMISFRLTVDELRQLERAAARDSLNVSDFVRRALERMIHDGGRL